MTPILPVTKIVVTSPSSPDAAGPAPQLDWIRIDRLVVDEAYQRPVTEVGRRNIRKIAESFRWSSFSPVVVAPVAGGCFAIVDGQHRTTAAALCGFESVPCQIILAARGGQAEAFTAINGVTTRMHGMAVHKAAVAAGDEKALAVERVAKAAGVTVLRYPKSVLNQMPGETMAIGKISALIERVGEPDTVLGLRCIRETSNDARGMLLGPIMEAVTLLVADYRRLRRTEAEIIAAVDQVKVIREFDKAHADARAGGLTIASALQARLKGRLDIILSRVAA
jgi:hypothetical protein